MRRAVDRLPPDSPSAHRKSEESSKTRANTSHAFSSIGCGETFGNRDGGGWRVSAANEERRKLHQPDLRLRGTFRSYLEDSELKAWDGSPAGSRSPGEGWKESWQSATKQETRWWRRLHDRADCPGLRTKSLFSTLFFQGIQMSRQRNLLWSVKGPICLWNIFLYCTFEDFNATKCHMFICLHGSDWIIFSL